MDVHEFQAKEILQKYGMPVPPFAVASSLKEVESAMQLLNLSEAVIKVQVHAGGRGKAGGVQFAKGKDEIMQKASALIGMKIVNNQTGAEGITAHQVMIASPLDIEKEYYLAAAIDRANAQAILMVSPFGGMDIEEVAEKTPDQILKVPIQLDGSVRPYHLVQIASFMGWEGDLAKQGKKIAAILARAFIESDASLFEINPLVQSKDGKLWALDAKLGVDDNALFRQKEIASFFDPTQISPLEVEAKKHDLAYVALDGDIGCMVNGAGLAMATMDIIKLYGGKPANFLDVGGSATADIVKKGCLIILSDTKVKAIFVNIFGGIMNCATIADGVIKAVKELDLKVPLIVRLEGTNVDAGRKLLEESGLKITSATSMKDGAEKVVNSIGA